VLNYAAWEADRLHHRHVGTEHLLLGLLRDDHGRAADPLRNMNLQAIRQVIAERTASLRHQVRTLDDVLDAVERLRRLALQYRDAPADGELLVCIREELDGLNEHFR
jgi:ATP-dependent Clp protease ATP-binding subunit ClpA